jgi:hypothetical protein
LLFGCGVEYSTVRTHFALLEGSLGFNIPRRH